MEDRIINRGKDWFAFTKGMVDYMVKPIPRKKKGSQDEWTHQRH